MAKGKVYRLVDADGCRVIHLPLNLWPALTGIITDNEYQFTEDCYKSLVEEIVNMPCNWLPESYAYFNFMEWSSAGAKTINLAPLGEGVKRRLAHTFFMHISDGAAKCQIYAVKGDDAITVGYFTNITSQIPTPGQGDVFLVEGDFIRFVVTVAASSGTFYVGLWGEEWTT
jgi:hypothetical protein